MSELKRMKKLLEENTRGGQRRVAQTFRDFCELAAITLRNAVDGRVTQDEGWLRREQRHLEISEGYDPKERDRFAEILALLTSALGHGLDDVLGKLYMSLDLGNDALGQHFTSFDVSLLVAKLAEGGAEEAIDKHGFVTVQEPACGSGGMIIAFAQALKDQGLNYQRELHVTATDLDITAVHMSYVQLALLWIPAIVVHGNTLSLETFDVWPTPAHVLGDFRTRLRLRSAAEAAGRAIVEQPKDTARV